MQGPQPHLIGLYPLFPPWKSLSPRRAAPAATRAPPPTPPSHPPSTPPPPPRPLCMATARLRPDSTNECAEPVLQAGERCGVGVGA
jgi:hypothetical protein